MSKLIWSSETGWYKPTVIISVSGGVADIESNPDEVNVIIRDYDECEAGDWDRRPDFCPDHE